MSGVNKAIIVGRLGRDPELRTTQGGTAVCNLSIATDRTYQNSQSNEKVQETEWHRVTVWGKQAEMCGKYLSKGREVYVEGRLRTSQYEKPDHPGLKLFSTEIVAETVQFLGGRDGGDGGDGGGGGDNQGASSQSSGSSGGGGGGGGGGGEADLDDDIPF